MTSRRCSATSSRIAHGRRRLHRRVSPRRSTSPAETRKDARSADARARGRHSWDAAAETIRRSRSRRSSLDDEPRRRRCARTRAPARRRTRRGNRCAPVAPLMSNAGVPAVTDPGPSPTRSCSAARWTSLERALALSLRRRAQAVSIPSRDRRAGSGRSRCRSRPSRKRAASATAAFMPCCWYERDFELRARPTTARSCASAPSTTPPGSGSTATSRSTHEGGHTPFSADITAHARSVGAPEGDGAGRSTTRTTSPSRAASRTGSASRTRSGTRARPGIWQTVWIERVGRTYVDKIRWTPHVDTYAIRFEARIGGDPVDDLAVEVTLRHGERAARARPLPGGRPRGRPLHRPRRSRHRRLPQRAALEPRAADPARRDGAPARRRAR